MTKGERSAWIALNGKRPRARPLPAWKKWDQVHLHLPGLRRAACGFVMTAREEEFSRTGFLSVVTCLRCKEIATALDPRVARLASLSDCARHLGVRVGDVRRLVEDGRLPADRLDGSWVVLRDDLAEFAARMRTAGSPGRSRP